MKSKKPNFVQREISWLAFNGRVLQEAADLRNPLIERLKFLGIFSNNLDEFFRVRVATLSRIARLEKKHAIQSSVSPAKVMKKISEIAGEQQERFLEVYEGILKSLGRHRIYFLNEKELDAQQGRFVREFYHQVLRSHLFPIMLNSLEDASKLRDKSPYLVVYMRNRKGKGQEKHALIEIPDRISRYLILPPENGKKFIMFLDDVIRYCLRDIFSMFSFELFSAYTIKFTRDAELELEDDVSKSLMELIQDSLKQRKVGRPIRFIYDEAMPEKLLKLVLARITVPKNAALLPGGRYHNNRDFMDFPAIGPASLINRKEAPLDHPLLKNISSLFSVIKKQDVMLHFPYQSYQYIVDLLREASIDPDVLSIKITIYRVATNSNVMNALINAARNGKQVTVLMEFQARFDEQNNIRWSEKLQEEGVRILQSRSGFKVHAKLLLLERKEGRKILTYAHIGTGNFNEDTARVYADDSLLTADPRITTEVAQVFDLVEFQYKNYKFKELVISPFNMRDHFITLLKNEIRNAAKGLEAWAIIKLNNLADEKIASVIYEAARSGVKIRLIVRGICVLAPEKDALPEDDFRAISIVDQYLEHSRIFIFCNNGENLYYLSSADWMIRNFDYRVEVACPIYDPRIQARLRQMLNLQLDDTMKARILAKGQKNEYVSPDADIRLQSQIEIYQYLKRYGERESGASDE